MTALKRAVEIAGSQTALAKAIGKQQGHVWGWLNGVHPISADFVIPISRAVGWQVTPHELRPDIYPNPSDGLPAEVVEGEGAA